MLDNPSWTILTGWQLVKAYAEWASYMIMLAIVILAWPRSFRRF